VERHGESLARARPRGLEPVKLSHDPLTFANTEKLVKGGALAERAQSLEWIDVVAIALSAL
jgi:hypothetical protein